MNERIQILDTTLRDGNKLPFVFLDTRARLEIARQLAQLGVDILDAGYPAASREDQETVALVAREIEGPYIAALSRALKNDIDKALEALKDCQKPYLHIFLPVSSQFLAEVLKKDRDEGLKKIEQSVRIGKEAGVPVQFSLSEVGEAERDFLLEAVRTACASGVEVLNLADTNGSLYPVDVSEIIAQVRESSSEFPETRIGVHFHNDFGLGTANTLAAIEAGARHVEATVGGIGPRGGNTPLEEVVFGLEAFTHRFRLEHGIKLDQLHLTASLISLLTGVQPHPNKPMIGKCAFQEPPGSHARDSLPAEKKRLLSNQTIGRIEDTLIALEGMTLSGFRHQLEALNIPIKEIDLEKVYRLCQSQLRRKRFVRISELLAMVEDARLEAESLITLVSFNVMTGSNTHPMGTVELKRDDKTLIQCSSGTGPVDALCQAVDRAVGLMPKLVLYTADSLTEGKDARAEVTVTLAYQGKHFHGHNGSTDVVEASLRAYLDAINQIEIYRSRAPEEKFFIDGEYLWE